MDKREINDYDLLSLEACKYFALILLIFFFFLLVRSLFGLVSSLSGSTTADNPDVMELATMSHVNMLLSTLLMPF